MDFTSIYNDLLGKAQKLLKEADNNLSKGAYIAWLDEVERMIHKSRADTEVGN